MDSLERLQGLYADLTAFTEERLPNIERLWHQLQDTIDDFKSLLDKPQVSASSTADYRNGKIQVGDQEYGINEEFRSLCVAIGSALDIEEESAGRLIIQTQDASTHTDEDAVIAAAVGRYHDQRDLLLQNLRILFEQALTIDTNTPPKEQFLEIIARVLDIPSGTVGNASPYIRKCLATLVALERRQTQLSEQIQSRAYLGQARGKAFYATLEFQHGSTFKQHEALGTILAWLFRGNYSTSEDLRKLHDASKYWQRLDFLCVHYFPAFAAAFKAYGNSDFSGQAQEAQSLNEALISKDTDSVTSPGRPIMAMLEMWWTANYSSFWRDGAAPDPSAGKRDSVMSKALGDGALELMLTICASIKHNTWHQPARQELVEMLLDGSSVSFEGSDHTSTFFSLMLMECYDSFIEAWITNMPDCIRKLKTDEDDRRLTYLTTPADGSMQRSPHDHGTRLHLESLLVLIAFAFESRPEAAEQFWEDPDSNLYGFLQWGSRRQTVPRVGAFCEMLCAISNDKDNTEAAHKFLLEDTVPIVGMRGRKLPSLSYHQIFEELAFYSRRVHEKNTTSQLVKVRLEIEPELNEAESPIMLSSYLRLLSHLCRQNEIIRDYVLGITAFDLLQALLTLSSGSIPSYLRASIFEFLESLAEDFRRETRYRLWSSIDVWASTNHDRSPNVQNPQQNSVASLNALQDTLAAIAASADQFDAFVRLLAALNRPVKESQNDVFTFPPDLGGAYRAPGISPYIDMVLSRITPARVRDWTEESSMQGELRCLHCIDLLAICLESFDETYARLPSGAASSVASTEDFATAYIQRHPFARAMQWVFSVGLNKVLLELLHQSPDTIVAAFSDHPRLLNLQRVLDVFIAIMSLQPTYFDIVRPKIRQTQGLKSVQSTGSTAIEDGIITYPVIILDLCQYAATEHVQLALKSMVLLQKLSVSAHFCHHLSRPTENLKVQRMIDMIGPTGELNIKNVSSSLTENFDIDFRDLEAGVDSPRYMIRNGILSFLNNCLVAQSDSANLAHLLVGFQRAGTRLVFSPELEEGKALLDALIDFTYAYPGAFDDDMLSWLLHSKTAAILALQNLWSFPVSSELVMTQLRRSRYFNAQFASMVVVSQTQMWEGQTVFSPRFWYTDSAEALTEFLLFRSALYDYVSKEIRYASKNNILTLQEQYSSTIQGRSTDIDGSPINHATVLDLFDFAELDVSSAALTVTQPDLVILQELPLDSFKSHATDATSDVYDVEKARISIIRFGDDVRQQYVQAKQPDEAQLRDLDEQLGQEEDYLIQLLIARNRYHDAEKARMSALRSYVDMIISVVESLLATSPTRTQFLLQTLQTILPKLDTYMSDKADETMELTRLADTLLFALSRDTTNDGKTQSRLDATIADKLFQLFRICVEGIPTFSTQSQLRSTLYSICSQYLTRILTVSTAASAETSSSPIKEAANLAGAASHRARQNAMDTLRSASTILLTSLADDAEDGTDTTRLNALSFLAQLVNLARTQRSNLVIDALVKQNFLEMLLEPLKNIAGEFAGLDPSNRNSLLTTHTTRLNLLLTISLTQHGASSLFSAGLLSALRASLLFAADPDLGIDLEVVAATAVSIRTQSTAARGGGIVGAAKSALTTYFTLLSLCLRLLLSTYIHFGVENEKAIYTIRAFLSEYRGNMVGVFKKHAGISINEGSVTGRELIALVDECARCYTGLAVGCGFMEFEDEQGVGGNVVVGGGLRRSRAGFT